jgi:hypothetical protein
MSPAALSPAKADRLYWLGRYVQRALAAVPGSPELLDISSPVSLTFNLNRAYDNGFLLRDLLDNDVFSYLRMASTKASTLNAGDYLVVREVHDALYAFWGILEEALFPEAEALCRWGRFLELWESRNEKGEGPSADAAWDELIRCWNVLRVGQPGRTVAEVELWFGKCYGE